MEVTLGTGITNFEFQNLSQKSAKEYKSDNISQYIEFDDNMFNYNFDYGSINVFA